MNEQEIIAGYLVRRRSKFQYLQAIQKRIDYLDKLIEEKRTNGSLHKYDSGEREALRWAMSLLVPYVERNRKRQLRGQSIPILINKVRNSNDNSA